MTSNDYLAPIAAKLTFYAAINLRSTVTSPCPLNPNAIHGKGRIYTGLGKWTHIAAIGVENNIKSLGLGVEVKQPSGSYHVHITPLGREVAAYIDANWDELSFREPTRRR